jgi:hypothetical protein
MTDEQQYLSILKDKKNIQRFNSNVDKGDPDECWNWSYCCEFHILAPGDKLVNFQPSRIALTIAKGPPKEGREKIRHICGNNKCCNPSHLRWRTGKI